MPAQLLTKQAKITAEQQRISRLTNLHGAHFKVILSHQIDTLYDFSSLHKGKRGRKRPSRQHTIEIFRALGQFLDETTRLTITEVEAEYGRPTDTHDGTYDPEAGREVQVEHLCLYAKDATPRQSYDSIRLHGYFRTNGGYFVVTRLDWFHDYHKVRSQ